MSVISRVSNAVSEYFRRMRMSEEEIKNRIIESLTRAGEQGRRGWQIAREHELPRPKFYRILSRMVLDGQIVRVLTPRDKEYGRFAPPIQTFYVIGCAPAAQTASQADTSLSSNGKTISLLERGLVAATN